MCHIGLRLCGAFICYFIVLSCFNHSIFQHIAAGSPGSWNATWTDHLKRDLLLKYDKFARPAQHFNTTRVFFGITIFHISVDEFKSAISIQAWVKMLWTDDKLKWNSTEYGGLRRLQVGNHEVWQPDIILYNSVTISAMEHYGDTHCHIYEDGSVVWVPPTQFHALCDLDLRLWPYDTQTCALKLGSWTHPGNEIDLRLDNTSLEGAVHLIKNSEWKLLELTRLRNITTYACCPDEPYIYLVFTFKIKRNSPLYSSLFVTPAAAIVILCLVNFWLPPQSKEKLILCSCTALMISLFLIYFANKIPPHSSAPPLIVMFYSGCLYQVIISLIISTIVINLSQRPYCRPLPRTVRKILVGWPGKYLGLSDLTQLSQNSIGEQELSESHMNDSSIYTSDLLASNTGSGDSGNIICSATRRAQLEWIMAATAIDRVAFLLFCNIFALMGITCMS